MITIFERAAREHIASRSSKETRGIYLGYLTKWLLFCELEKIDPDAIPFTAAVKFRDQIEAQYASSTVRTIMSAISSMYDTAGLLNHFGSSKRLPRPPADEVSLTPAFSQEEAQKLLDVAERDLRDRALFQVLYDTGMRVTQAASMLRESLVREETGVVLVSKVKKKGRVKTSIPASSMVWIDRWLAVAPPSKYVFPADCGRGPVTRQTVGRHLRAYAKEVGVKKAKAHMFRAMYVTESLDAGVPLHEVSASVSHSSTTVTMRYDRGSRGAGVADALAAFREKRGRG